MRITTFQFCHLDWAVLTSLKPRLQLDLLSRLINQRRPNVDDWRNLFLEIEYQFQRSSHYGLVLAVGLIASVVTVTEIILLVFNQPEKWLNGFLGLAIYLILIFWISLWQGIEQRFEPKTFIQFGLLGILTFGTEIQRLLRGRLVWALISSISKSISIVAVASVAVSAVAFVADFAVAGFSVPDFAVGVPGLAVAVGVAGGVAGLAVDAGVAIAVFAVDAGVAIAVFAVVGFAVDAAGFAVDAVGVTAFMGMGLGFWYGDKSKTDFLRFLAIFALPYFCWFPIVVVFSTLFMLRYLTWQYTILTWFIVLGTCFTLWIYGNNKERKASNPLRGILDVAK